MNLVKLHEERLVVSTVEIAKHFSKEHKKVLRAINNLHCSKEFKEANFVPHEFKAGNNTYPCYLLTRDGFSYLVMGFTGKEAAIWKERYINAFNQMEGKLQSLINKSNPNWSQVRLQSKSTRNTLTDTIKEFVEYSSSQGSKSAQYYYSNITRMEYKALRLSELYSKEKNLRDQLELMDLNFLMVAESLCKLSLEEGMDKGLPYKQIFQLTKERITTYTNSINPLRFPLLDSSKS